MQRENQCTAPEITRLRENDAPKTNNQMDLTERIYCQRVEDGEQRAKQLAHPPNTRYHTPSGGGQRETGGGRGGEEEKENGPHKSCVRTLRARGSAGGLNNCRVCAAWTLCAGGLAGRVAVLASGALRARRGRAKASGRAEAASRTVAAGSRVGWPVGERRGGRR